MSSYADIVKKWSENEQKEIAENNAKPKPKWNVMKQKPKPAPELKQEIKKNILPSFNVWKEHYNAPLEHIYNLLVYRLDSKKLHTNHFQKLMYTRSTKELVEFNLNYDLEYLTSDDDEYRVRGNIAKCKYFISMNKLPLYNFNPQELDTELMYIFEIVEDNWDFNSDYE